jgi:hypothetical protein
MKHSTVKRLWHPWNKWECVSAGLFGWGLHSDERARELLFEFFCDDQLFKHFMNECRRHWPVSCEQFLTNPNINRIAWIG